ncbi:MAG: cytochrome P450 [Caldilineaceae bacterium]|nr:cytochrome P450 [Caldilineaceae bacterium]
MTNPTPPFVSGALPLVGHALRFSRDAYALDRRGHAEHGDVFAIKLGGKPVAVVTGAEYNKLFYTQTDDALNIGDVYTFLKATFGEVLFMASKESYRNQRPILQAIFSRERMARYVQAMQTEVQLWLDSLGEQGEMDITAEMLRLTQHVAGRAFIGAEFRAELGEDFWQDYDALSRAIDPLTPPNLPLPKFRRRDRALRRIRETLLPVLAKRQQHPERYDDLITLLLEQPQKDGTPLPKETIIQLFMGLLFAGHETTAGQAAWTVIQLLQHPDYLAQVQAEIAEQVTPGGSIDGGVLRNLKHIYWAIDETTRLRPSAPMQLRLVERALDVGGYTVPVGWLMRVTAATSHHQPDVFADADTYDPLRFSPERAEGSTFDIIGFGGGLHKCTGMNFAKNEMAVITALIFQQFDLDLLTPNTKVITGVGANRPSATTLRYRRTPQVESTPAPEAVLVA